MKRGTIGDPFFLTCFIQWCRQRAVSQKLFWFLIVGRSVPHTLLLQGLQGLRYSALHFTFTRFTRFKVYKVSGTVPYAWLLPICLHQRKKKQRKGETGTRKAMRALPAFIETVPKNKMCMKLFKVHINEAWQGRAGQYGSLVSVKYAKIIAVQHTHIRTHTLITHTHTHTHVHAVIAAFGIFGASHSCLTRHLRSWVHSK